MAKFKVGQSVRLKGQPYSPTMTVRIDDPNHGDEVYVTFWKTDTNCFKRESFKESCLDLVSENELKELMEKASKA